MTTDKLKNWRTLGATLRARRAAMGLGMNTVAEALEISSEMLGNWERGQNRAPTVYLRKLANFYGIEWSEVVKVAPDAANVPTRRAPVNVGAARPVKSRLAAEGAKPVGLAPVTDPNCEASHFAPAFRPTPQPQKVSGMTFGARVDLAIEAMRGLSSAERKRVVIHAELYLDEEGSV